MNPATRTTRGSHMNSGSSRKPDISLARQLELLGAEAAALRTELAACGRSWRAWNAS
jgi:hypothetical protein